MDATRHGYPISVKTVCFQLLRWGLVLILVLGAAVARAHVVPSITAGGEHTCVVTSAGAALCWGSNQRGELGNGSTFTSTSPVAVSGLASGVIVITGGNYFTCALTDTGAAWCWGGGSLGQLGNGVGGDQYTPVAVSGLASGLVAIAAGQDHACAVTTAGAAKCWGGNSFGQLGNGTTTNSYTPVAVSGLTSGVVTITAGAYHTCARTNTGAVKCWGNNSSGQLGNGTTINSTTPVAVSGLASGVAAISAGGSHTCAITNTGAAWCWGSNLYGRLGNGTTTDSSTPVAVGYITSGATAISAGGMHTCAVVDGAALCWGAGSLGQLGDGGGGHSSWPSSVNDLWSGVFTIAAGGTHSCALTDVGDAWCWGNDNRGAVGNGGSPNSSDIYYSPVQVVGVGGQGLLNVGTPEPLPVDSEIPTLPQWATIFMTLILIGLGSSMMRRKGVF